MGQSKHCSVKNRKSLRFSNEKQTGAAAIGWPVAQRARRGGGWSRQIPRLPFDNRFSRTNGGTAAV